MKNTVERTEGSHVVSFKADPTVSIPKGSAVSISDDYEVTVGASGVFSQGVALEVHASGVMDCIPVLLAGPVIRVTIGAGDVTAGALVNGDNTNPGEWIIDATNPAGFALEAASDGEEADICFVGEQH
jgi:hypothetical protein